jgi:Flp pilus assembly protein TadD
MPETKYMIVDPRRDHSFQIPRPDISVKLNVPNSCNRCHKDQSARWAADKVNEWYPSTREKREKETHFAEIFAAGQAGKAEAEAGLVKVARDQSQPAIIRATALNILSAYRSQDALDVTALSLNDDDPLVRYEAVRGISALIHKRLGANDQQKKYSTLVPLLKDPIRAVRTEAARAVTEVPKELFNQLHRKDFEKALDEYKERQQAIADRPESHLNLGLMYENEGEKDKAETSYKTAMRLVPDFLPARFNLANLYNLMGRNADAERVLRDGIKQVPNEGQLYYSLGLLLAEEKRYPEAANNLGKAAELMPKNARAHYNHGLALQHLGRRSGAETALLKAHRLGRSDPSILQALAVFYFQGRQWDQATIYAEQLARLYPNERGPSQMLEQINKARGTQ